MATIWSGGDVAGEQRLDDEAAEVSGGPVMTNDMVVLSMRVVLSSASTTVGGEALPDGEYAL